MAGHLKRNLLIGLAGGLAGTAALRAYARGLNRLKPELAAGEEETNAQKLARRMMQRAGVRSPSRQVQQVGGKVVQWSHGATWGLAAGASRAAGVPITWGAGIPLGVGLWVLSDEWAPYKLGLARHPKEYAMKSHAATLGGRLAYSVSLWAAMKGLGAVAGAERRRGFLKRVA